MECMCNLVPYNIIHIYLETPLDQILKLATHWVFAAFSLLLQYIPSCPRGSHGYQQQIQGQLMGL